MDIPVVYGASSNKIEFGKEIAENKNSEKPRKNQFDRIFDYTCNWIDHSDIDDLPKLRRLMKSNSKSIVMQAQARISKLESVMRAQGRNPELEKEQFEREDAGCELDQQPSPSILPWPCAIF